MRLFYVPVWFRSLSLARYAAYILDIYIPSILRVLSWLALIYTVVYIGYSTSIQGEVIGLLLYYYVLKPF